MAITERSLGRAEGRMRARQHGGHAVSARYDRRSARIIVSLNTGVEVTFPPRLAEGLAGATPADLAQIEISPAGLGQPGRQDAGGHRQRGGPGALL